MPNHVTSRSVVTGPADEVARFKSRMIVEKMEERREYWPTDRVPKPYTAFDFNAIIPMPECLRGSEASSIAEEGMALIVAKGGDCAPFATLGLYDAQIERIRAAAGLDLRASISDVAEAFLAANPRHEELGKARMAALLETGYANWYPWSIANWGTKWGAYSVALEFDDPLTFKFETAWSFPTPVFEALSAEFPSLTFDCVCFDEGWNFAGVGCFGATGARFGEVEATDELYERVYGHAPEHDEEEAA